MNTRESMDELGDLNPEALLADGYEGAYLGYVCTAFAEGAVAVYDRRKCIQILVDRDGMTYEEAIEFFAFNTEGAYVGPFTPLYLTTPESE